jgi:hypothetical protein
VLWQAGGIEDQERAAWRNLVAGHGAGRAAWLESHYTPLNAQAKPTKAQPEDVILVLTSETAPAGNEADAIAAFWRAKWIAGGRRTETDAARAALRSAVGSARAVEIEKSPPVNFRQGPTPPLRRDQVQVSTVFLLFPPREQVETQRNSWSRPPRVAAWPDRFLLIGYRQGDSAVTALGKPIPNPLIAGLDPSDPSGLRMANGEVQVPDDMKWMLDFNRAVDVGMGFRLDLSGGAAQSGFDKIVVIGVKATADAASGRTDLEELIKHHRYGAHGFAILRQGTPTNNTEEGGAGFSATDEADESFDDLFDSEEHPRPKPSTDWLLKTDGQWLAELLGIDPAAIAGIPGSAGLDQAEARRMNLALWPATLGYWMDTMMNPVFQPDAVERTRDFFQRFVSGRGSVPALRIGTQPYGVLATTAFSRMSWMSALAPATTAATPAARERAYYEGLRDVLKTAAVQWTELARGVSMVGGPGDPHQTLLDVVGLHATSVKYSTRYSEGFDVAYNRLRLSGGSQYMSPATVATLVATGKELLSAHGYNRNDIPDLLKQFQFTNIFPLSGPIIDTVPLSEVSPIRVYTPAPEKNYIEWLATAARTSLTALEQQAGFIDSKAPTALLYLLLRYALLEGYYDAGAKLRAVRLQQAPGVVMAVRREPSFVYVDPLAPDLESRVALMTLTDVQVTGRPNVTLGDHITRELSTLTQAQRLKQQIDALELLAKVPTARLERLLAEHVDCCGYRLDAWMSGLVQAQLTRMRNVRDLPDPAPGAPVTAPAPNKGVLLGAYGWLLNVRPRAVDFTAAQVTDASLRGLFARHDQSALLRDATNGGFIHAPSLNHAVAAAVLRSGYLANGTSANPGTFAVRLTSERVRRALGILDGMRAGQSLGALLGYQFERGLHDRHSITEVDEFIFELRQEFPLQLDRMQGTKRSEQDKANSIEARDVVDGERLADHVGKEIAAGRPRAYPFGKGATLPAASPAQQQAIDAEVDRLLDTFDAVADLLMAEGVYQAIHGNYDRVAATLDAAAGVNLPPDPEVVRTPSRGFPITQRVALHLDPSATANPGGSTATPLSKAQPALNAWLNGVMPPLAQIACKASYRSSTGEQIAQDVSLADLGLQAVDVLRIVRDETGSELVSQELRDRIIQYLGMTSKPVDLDPDVSKLTIDPMTTRSAPISLCRAVSLIRTLRSLLSGARPLRASDLTPSGEATPSEDADVAIDLQRITGVKGDLEILKGELQTFRSAWESKVDDLEDIADRTEMATKIDDMAIAAMRLLVRASAFGIAIAGWRFIHERRSEVTQAVRRALKELVDRWKTSLDEYDAFMAAYAAATTDEDRFVALERAERRVSTTTTPRPASPSDLHATVQGKRQPFQQQRDQFVALYEAGVGSLSKLLADWRTLLQPIMAFDVVQPDLKPFDRKIHALAADVQDSVMAVLSDLNDPKTASKGRLSVAEAQLAVYNASVDPKVRLNALQAAGRALLGEDVTLIPDFGLTDEHADEISNAVADRSVLLQHLTVREQIQFPVDEWLYTCARVREPMQRWERIVMLTGALGVTEPVLTPLQLPYRENDRWLASKIPPDYPADGERLLYTACFSRPYAVDQRQCGLLFDEWTEVIPLAELVAGETSRVPKQTTGIAFHFDRPNAQPPQTMLLVTPTATRGTWQWNDLLDAVNETIDLARVRGVEPAQVDATPYAIFLPATTTASSARRLTYAAEFHLNNVGVVLNPTPMPP